MTTFIPIAPAPYQFNVTFDGAPAIVQIKWNVSAQRNYVNIFDQTGTSILSIPLIGSPPNFDINLLNGYYADSQMVFRVATQQFEITP